MYNLVLAVVRAHNAKEALRKTEREGGAALKETSIAFNDDGEVLPPKTPAVAKVMMTHRAAVISGDADRPRAQRALQMGDDDPAFDDARDEQVKDESDEESEDDAEYDERRKLSLELLLAESSEDMLAQCKRIRDDGTIDGAHNAHLPRF